MRVRVFLLLLLVALAVPVVAWFVSLRVVPPPFTWSSDPHTLLVSRSPITGFPSAFNALVLKDSITALYRDGTKAVIVVKDRGDRQAVSEEMRKIRGEVVGDGGIVEGSDSDFVYRIDDGALLGRALVAENAVVHITAVTENQLVYKLSWIPYLEDRRGESLGRDLLENHRVAVLSCLGVYLLAVLLAIIWSLARRKS